MEALGDLKFEPLSFKAPKTRGPQVQGSQKLKTPRFKAPQGSRLPRLEAPKAPKAPNSLGFQGS